MAKQVTITGTIDHIPEQRRLRNRSLQVILRVSEDDSPTGKPAMVVVYDELAEELSQRLSLTYACGKDTGPLGGRIEVTGSWKLSSWRQDGQPRRAWQLRAQSFVFLGEPSTAVSAPRKAASPAESEKQAVPEMAAAE